MNVSIRIAKLEARARPTHTRKQVFMLAGSRGYSDGDIGDVIRAAGYAYSPEADLAIVLVPVWPANVQAPHMPLHLAQLPPEPARPVS